MRSAEEVGAGRDAVGLCASCAFARVVGSARGGRFYLCALSRTDPRFVKYPRLPVVRCAGYRRGAAGGGPEVEEKG